MFKINKKQLFFVVAECPGEQDSLALVLGRLNLIKRVYECDGFLLDHGSRFVFDANAFAPLRRFYPVHDVAFFFQAYF